MSQELRLTYKNQLQIILPGVKGDRTVISYHHESTEATILTTIYAQEYLCGSLGVQ
jgi:hypothetical protein